MLDLLIAKFVIIYVFVIFVKWTIINTVENGNDDAKQAGEKYKGVIITNFVSIIDYISEINSIQTDKAKYLDVVGSMHNLIEYSDNYWKRLKVCDNIIEINQLII